MSFDNYSRDFLEIPENAPPSIAIGDPLTPPITIPNGDYTFNRAGRFVPVDSPEAVRYIVPDGMRVVMSEGDPEDDLLEDDTDLDTDLDLEDEDEDSDFEDDEDEECSHGYFSDEHCPTCDGEEDEDEDENDFIDTDDEGDLEESDVDGSDSVP